jgi:hypothetical protein
MTKINNKIKRRTDSKESQEFWKAVDRIISPKDAKENKVQVGEPWTDSERDLSASIILNLIRHTGRIP